jgi:hypothetical protein
MSPVSLDKILKRMKGVSVGSKTVLHNKYVLYFIFIIALLNLFFAAVKMDFLYCAIFILVGFLTSFFCKNMLVILVITLAVANIIRVVIRGGTEFEGMESGGDSLLEEAEVDVKVNKGEGEDSKKDEKKMVNELKSDAHELIDAQEKIIAGFDTIEPYMQKAETLIDKIDKSAKKIEGLRGSGEKESFTVDHKGKKNTVQSKTSKPLHQQPKR